MPHKPSNSQFATPIHGTPELAPTSEISQHISSPLSANGTLNGSVTSSDKKKPVVCVFCGAKDGKSPVHLEAARELAQSFHKHGISLVYGGGTVGIMGELAKTLVSLSGPSSVHGIIPAALMRYEQGWDDSDPSSVGKAIDENIFGKTTVVKDMHTRKQLMAKEVISGGEGGGFVALSGGYGTLEELMEVTTWNQLGIHDKGVVIYNVDGYWDGLIAWVKTAVEHAFIANTNAGILVEAKNAEDVVLSLKDYKNAPGRFDLDWTKEG